MAARGVRDTRATGSRPASVCCKRTADNYDIPFPDDVPSPPPLRVPPLSCLALSYMSCLYCMQPIFRAHVCNTKDCRGSCEAGFKSYGEEAARLLQLWVDHGLLIDLCRAT